MKKIKIKPVKVKVKKPSGYILRLKVDTNDADYKYHKMEISKSDIEPIKEMCQAISKFKPYKTKGKHFTLEHRHNFPTGSMYGFDMCRPDLGGLSCEEYYVGKGLVSQRSFDVFSKYVGRKVFHTIHKVDINDVNLFNLDRWFW